ncbi:hypothetical protein Tco_0902253 [Tanacetum coccineum]
MVWYFTAKRTLVGFVFRVVLQPKRTRFGGDGVAVEFGGGGCGEVVTAAVVIAWRRWTWWWGGVGWVSAVVVCSGERGEDGGEVDVAMVAEWAA